MLTHWFDWTTDTIHTGLWSIKKRQPLVIFHQAVKRHYSGKVENVSITLWQIHSGHYTANVIRISQVLQKIWQNIMAYLLLGHGIGILRKHDFQVLQVSAQTPFR